MQPWRRLLLLGPLPGTLLIAAAPGCSPGEGEDAAPPPAAAARDVGAAWRGALVGGDVVLLPATRSPGERLASNGRNTLFLNFEGTDVWPGNDALTHRGIRDDMKGEGLIEMDAYAPGDKGRFQKILQIHKEVAAWYADINLDVVITRPLTNEYQMTAVGGRQSDVGFPSGVVGISPGDCGNRRLIDLNYAFSASLGESPHQVAITAAHEAGHAFGLGHTQNRKDIMFPSVSSEPMLSFAVGEAADPGPCGFKMGDVQDGLAVLKANLGERRPDSGRPGNSTPKVRFLSPKDTSADLSEAVPVGMELTVAIAAESARGIDHVTITASQGDGARFRGGHAVAELRAPSSSAKIRLTEPGDYLLQATAYDQEGNLALAHSHVKVATPTCGVPNDCAPGQLCQNNVCTTKGPPADAEKDKPFRPLGTACLKSSECKGEGQLVGGICALTAIGKICTHYCSDGRPCQGGMSCVDGVCQPPTVSLGAPGKQQIGSRCSWDADCGMYKCSPVKSAEEADQRYCTKECSAEEAWSCPANMACQSGEGGKSLCAPIVQQVGGGGCQLAGKPASRPELAWLAGLALTGWSLARRRRGRARARPCPGPRR